MSSLNFQMPEMIRHLWEIYRPAVRAGVWHYYRKFDAAGAVGIVAGRSHRVH
jgi:hypothetical protein